MTVTRTPYTLDRVVRLVITVLLVLGALWLVNRLKTVLLPFCVAVLISYILEPFVQYNRRLLHLKGRITAIFVTLFETVFILGVLCMFFIPQLVDECQQMGAMLRNYAVAELNIPYLPEAIHRFIRRYIDFNAISDMLTKREWMSVIEEALNTSWSIISVSWSVILGILNWFIVILYVIFIMIDYDRISRGFRWMVPPKWRQSVYRIGNDIKDSMNHYFRGQALVAFIVGVLFSIGFLIIGLPLAVPLGLFIGLLNMVPYLQFVSVLPMTVLCLVYAAGTGTGFWTIFGESVVVYAVVQAIQDLYLVPRIMGKAMGLNPAIILLSLSVWGSLLGFLGLIIALPLTTLLIAYYNRYVIDREEGATPSERRRALHNAENIEHKPIE